MSTSKSFGRRRRFGLGAATLALIAALVGATALAASAASDTIAVKTVKLGSKRESIAVNGKGLSVYELLPETARHPLCTKASGCFGVWPPVTVRSGTKLTKASGVSGKLGTFTRNGITQVTLSGHPLYTFEGDNGKAGVANGDGIRSFGGTWHVLGEGKAKSSSSPGGW